MTPKPGPLVSRGRAAFTLSLRLSPQLGDLDIPKHRDSCHPAESPQERAGYGQSPAWSLLPEEKSFRAAPTLVTYSGLSYRSTWLAPSTTWIFLGSLARR